MKKFIKWLTFLVTFAVLLTAIFAPALIDKRLNQTTGMGVTKVSESARQLHSQLTIMDWHADTMLWQRDILESYDYGHIDLSRLQKGNVALQMFTTVTKVPEGLNYELNSSDARDQITALAMVQAWPVSTWNSLLERALYQAKRLNKAAKQTSELMLITSQEDLQLLLALRQQNKAVVGALLGTEGSHALEGNLNNIKILYQAGFRMMSLQHFFDNRLGGSLHGESEAGLTDLGRDAVQQIQAMDIILDVSHSSIAVVEEVLDIAVKPIVVSHTGVYGHCAKVRNLPDTLMQRIAESGGLIAIGHWQGAVCESSIPAIVAAIRYAIDLVGVEHVALGSDFDGAVSTPVDVAHLEQLTQEMLSSGFTRQEIAKVMGTNSIEFLKRQLPRH